jgi:adenylylsulfate kinase
MSWAIWITGLPGSGKSARARAAAATLRARGVPVTVLELDMIRKVVTPAPTYSDGEREAVYRLLVFMAVALTDADIPVIIDATAYRRRWRDLAREAIARFAEIQLDCPLAVCRERETTRTTGHAPRGIYAHGGQAGATVPGVDREYERALSPELVIDTAEESVAAGAEKIVALAATLDAGRSSRAAPGRGWALWITGLPGSGKTTITRRVAEALSARGLPVRVLEAAAARRVLGPAAGPGHEDLVHRALACTARLLAEAGVPVIIDATAPRRRWRELARELIGYFAEVQLVCPAEVCAGRERAGRWTPPLGTLAVHEVDASAPPEIVFDYEPSLRPELTVYTDVQDHVTVVDGVLFVAERLHAAATTDDRRGGRP